jgi:hypothetical protein
MSEIRSLAGELLSGAAAISRYLYGDDSTYHQRRTRHLIAKGFIPVKRVAGRVESRTSWIDEAYAEPDQPNGKAKK